MCSSDKFWGPTGRKRCILIWSAQPCLVFNCSTAEKVVLKMDRTTQIWTELQLHGKVMVNLWTASTKAQMVHVLLESAFGSQRFVQLYAKVAASILPTILLSSACMDSVEYGWVCLSSTHLSFTWVCHYITGVTSIHVNFEKSIDNKTKREEYRSWTSSDLWTTSNNSVQNKNTT